MSDQNNPAGETEPAASTPEVIPEPAVSEVEHEGAFLPVIVGETLDLLGHRVKDKITDFEGVVVSVTFDVNGCIQAIVKPKVDNEGKSRYAEVIDVQRLEILSDERIVERPDWADRRLRRETYDRGPHELPTDYLAGL